MGKRGGKRPGAGRPRKHNLTVVSPGKVASVPPPKVTGDCPQAPDRLSDAARSVWNTLAPLATKEGTLVDGTVADFADVCELAVQRSNAQAAVSAQPVGSQEWVTVSRVYMAYDRDLRLAYRAFRLAPNGLPMVQPEPEQKPTSALEQLKARRQALHAVR